MRCGLQNIHLLPENPWNCKSQQSLQHAREGECDLFLMNEVASCWSKLAADNQWEERIIGSPRSTENFANNTTEPMPSEKSQQGGVVIVATGEGKPRKTDRRTHPSGPGRWVWV
jgi:hypothetical protein